jgi:hypothetical protein
MRVPQATFITSPAAFGASHARSTPSTTLATNVKSRVRAEPKARSGVS